MFYFIIISSGGRIFNYDGFINKTIDGQPKVIVASNRNGSNNYISGDNNNKYITYFADEYFTTLGLTAADYNFFYPNVSYTKFNVLGGSVKEADIIAENGIIHEVDNVSLPPVNIDQYLEQNSIDRSARVAKIRFNFNLTNFS